jgi:Rod binding domain-containing protein
MTGLDALPSVPASALPAELRAAPQEDQQAYRAALGFERMLLQTVVKDMTRSGGLADSPYAGAIEDSMSDALVAGGGLGLGDQLYHAMRPENLK